jgi:two-component system, NtrC family, sensor kinase
MLFPPASLRHKISAAYYFIVTLFIILILFAFIELSLLEKQIAGSEKITDFFDATLEVRRFEKNYFLYHQDQDYHENLEYLSQATRLLQEHGDMFQALPGVLSAPDLSAELGRYAKLMQQYRQQRTAALAEDIRDAGKWLVASGEQLARSQRSSQRASLARQRQILLLSALLLSAAVLSLGQWLSWRVAQPLRQMEAGMQAIAGGKRDKLEMSSHDREIALLVEAVNRMLEEIEIRQHYLLRSEKLAALGTLLAGVAHELNNPLSNISSSCQILQEELNSADPAYQQELLAQIDEQTQRARDIVRTLLDFTRVREFQQESLDLNTLIRETLRFLKGQLPAKLALSLEIPAGMRVYGDKQRLQQVFLNLLKNAAQAVPAQGEIVVRASRAVLAPRKCFEGEGVCVMIMDNGAGIPPVVLARIFDPFFTTKDVGHGSGLGLFIVHEIIEEHGGCIKADNRIEGGAVFSVWLPGEKAKECDP